MVSYWWQLTLFSKLVVTSMKYIIAMIRVNVSNLGSINSFSISRRLRGVITMCKIIQDFKIRLIKDGKTAKTIES